MRILVTGAAGFIGSKTVFELAKDHSNYIVAIDNMNDYYDVQLKQDRIKEFCSGYNVLFKIIDICDKEKIINLFNEYKFELVVNLAAQAGVRYSIDHPDEYINSNIIGFINILEACRIYHSKLIFASSSSVYGLNHIFPFSENDNVDRPVSLYAATKKSNELMAHAYSKLYDIHCIGLRFFTVYGPYGRPDMSPFLFAKEIVNNGKIKVFNNGDMYRDFTFIDDVVNGIINIVYGNEKKNRDGLYYNVYNIGYGRPVNLMDFIRELENNFGKEVDREYLPMQQGDVYLTYANTKKLESDYHYKPHVSIVNGVKMFADWYKEYYKIGE